VLLIKAKQSSKRQCYDVA